MAITTSVPNLFHTLNSVASNNQIRELTEQQSKQEKIVSLQRSYQPIYLKHLFKLLMSKVKSEMKQNASKIRDGYTVEVEITNEELIECFPQKAKSVFEYNSEFAQTVRDEFVTQGFKNEKVKILKFMGKTGEKRVFQITL